MTGRPFTTAATLSITSPFGGASGCDSAPNNRPDTKKILHDNISFFIIMFQGISRYGTDPHGVHYGNATSDLQEFFDD